jgi:hypothetical protein
LKPLNNVAQWRRAFDALQQPGEDNKLYWEIYVRL